jgi:hypothetical protein
MSEVMDVLNLKTKALNSLLKENGHKGYSKMNRRQKLELLTGESVPEGFKERRPTENMKAYNEFRRQKADEWGGISIIEAGKRIKEEGLWKKPEAKPEEEAKV